ncbi:MAG: Gfo/Idh/MocA family oxidoreductase, partial [Clostridiales bacterium]|nr:Gfo/Idh/MocA family oxidoreductase [Clostridiales bacterium]
MPQTNVGIVGCGVISGIYLDNITSRFKGVKALSCADMDSSKSAASASKYGLKQESVSELLANPDIDVVLNLTTPLSHKEISISALRAGKHVFSEKPLGATFAEASEIIDEADRLGLRVGCAPDTILGAGLQTAFEAVRSGSVGDPVAASAFFFCPGHELWHENPAFYYLPGGGPVLDMGPYYFTALVSALGPAKRVCAMSRRSGERTVHRGQLKGQSIPVEVDTHSSAIIEFESGVIATCMLSFDIWAAKLPRIEIYCSAGTILLPDPNTFGGPVLARGQSG